MSALQVELQELGAINPDMSLLDAVEYTISDLERRTALYGRCSAEDRSVNGLDQDVASLLKIASSGAKDLVGLERRAVAEDFQVQGG
jgi:hypothetical protein